MIKAVLFDFDETLQDRTAAFESYMKAFFKEFRPELKGGELEKYVNSMRVADNGGYVDRVKWHEGLKKEWKWDAAPPAKELAEHYIHTFGYHIKIYKNAPDVLKELKEKGYKVGVLTNGPSYLQNHKMRESGLLPLVDILLVGGDIGVQKPEARFFEIGAEKLNLKTNECVYVGDHPVNDIQGALNAGMKAIRMNTGWFKDKDFRPDVPVIDDIIQVPDVLETFREE